MSRLKSLSLGIVIAALCSESSGHAQFLPLTGFLMMQMTQYDLYRASVGEAHV
jgi:hypothetical protein